MKSRILNFIIALSFFFVGANAQTLSVSDIEVATGWEETLTVNIEGATEMTALQCVLTLPKGINLAKDTDNYGIELGNATFGNATNGHYLNATPLASGELLIVVYSMDLCTFKDGTLLYIPVTATEDFSASAGGSLRIVRTTTVAAESNTSNDATFTTKLYGEEQLVGGEFVINGIKYNGDAETRTASVIGVEEGFAATEVTIPETANGFIVTTIGDRLFANNKTITSVSLPNTVKSIEEKAFRGCTNLQSVSLGSSLETIGNDAFRLCENLASIDFPNSVYEIGEYAFFQCVSLRSVVLPTSLKAIRNSLFCQCENLESVEIPNSVEVIETWAFMYCESLKSITIPSSVVSIIPDGVSDGYLQFSGCSQLESIVVEEGNPVYDSRNNANAIIETSTNTLIIGCNNSTVPEGVERIDDYAFYDFNGLESVTLPSTLKEIGVLAFCNTGLNSIEIPASIVSLGEAAFNGCESLRKAVLPNTLTSIPASLFVFCRSLEEVNIPNGVESIGDMAFRRCGFSAIEIPTSVKTIGEAAFQGCVNMETITIPSSVTSISGGAFQNCDVLHTVVSQIETPFAIESNVFSRVIDGTETPTTAILYVPKGCKELYKSAEGWNQFSTILEEGETPEPEGLLTGKNYRVKNVTIGLYMQVSGNNTNMKLQNRAEGVELSQVFQLEDAGEGMYYIKAADLSNSYYAHASGWNFNATANAANKTPFTISLVEGEEGVYTLHQSVSNYKGLAGTDATEAGAAIYCNKGVDNNGKWSFEALTEEENAAYTATLTATARQAVEEAIARGEAVAANRSAVLTAEETAAINNAVQAAKEGKDAAADVTALKALSDAIHTAVDEAIYVWNTDALSNAMCYAVSTEDRGAWYAQASNLTSTAKAEVAVDVADSKQQFAFVKSPKNGALYLYSVSEAKFVKVEGQYTALTETPEQTISILNGTRSAQFPWVVALNAEDGQKQMGISNGYDPAVISHWNDLGDAGNTVRIEKVAAFDASAALAAIEALENPVISVTGITLSQTAATLIEGESLTLTATVAPEDATDKTITWSTSDAAIATVDNGVVTAVAAGTATITAKAGDKETTCVVTVAQKVITVTGITLSQTAATLTEGESLTLTATVAPDNATDKTVTWSSSNAAVATVDNNGVVTAVAEGTATITAKAGGKEATCVVTVAQKEEPFKGITSIDELNNETLYHVTLPHHSKGLASWAVAEGGTAMKSNVDLGLTSDATDAKQQFAFISNDGGATRYLYHAAEKKFVGKKGVLTEEPVDAILFKDGAHDNTFFAYFDENNYINVGGSQQMTIDRWSAADGGNSCVIAPVAVFNPAEALAAFVVKVSGITLSQTAATLTEGESLTLTATVAPDNATDKTVTWSSSDKSVATVDNNGKVTAVATGTATITAKAGDKEATCVVTVKASVPDGIDQLTIDNGQWTIYDLTGRKVTSTENLKGGIYIVNGRKVVIGD